MYQKKTHVIKKTFTETESTADQLNYTVTWKFIEKIWEFFGRVFCLKHVKFDYFHLLNNESIK
jgi:hypothetical protein